MSLATIEMLCRELESDRHRQVRGGWTDGAGGWCAVALMNKLVQGAEEDRWRCPGKVTRAFAIAVLEAGMVPRYSSAHHRAKEILNHVIHMNDRDGASFYEIAQHLRRLFRLHPCASARSRTVVSTHREPVFEKPAVTAVPPGVIDITEDIVNFQTVYTYSDGTVERISGVSKSSPPPAPPPKSMADVFLPSEELEVA